MPAPETLISEANPYAIDEDYLRNPFFFRHLPAYADFLLRNQLRNFAELQLELVKALHVPFFKYFESVPEAELIEKGVETTRNLLRYFAENKGKQYVEDAVHGWISNQIPGIARDQFTPEDVSGLSFIRRKIFRDFLPTYTREIGLHRSIMEEVDWIFSALDAKVLSKLFQLRHDLYKQAQAIAQFGNWTLDVKSNKIEWSDEVFTIYELSRQPLEYPDLLAYNHPDDKNMIQDKMKKALEEKKPFDFYYRIIVKSGAEKYLHARGTVEVDEKNEPILVMGTLRDASQQKKAENEINNRQNFIRKITNLAPAIIVAYNVNTGEYLFVNEAVKSLLGYDAQAVIDRGLDFFVDIIHPDDVKNVMEENVKKLEIANEQQHRGNDEIIVEFKYRMRHKNGQYRWFQNYGTIFSRDKDNRVLEVLNISTDVTTEVQQSTELLKKTEELGKNEERFHKMTEEVEDYAILLLNKDGFIENWTKGVEKIKGYRADEIIGKHFSIFYTPEDRTAGLPGRLIQEAVEKGKATHEGWRARKNGERFWGYIVITTLRDHNNEIFGFSKVTRDLTEKRLAEQKLSDYAHTLQIKNKELEQTNKELESFTFMASHDLQEPLRKIKTFTSFLSSREAEGLSDTGKDYLARIISGADRMQHLIEALLNFSRLGVGAPAFEITDLNTVLEEVKTDMSDLIISKKATIDSSQLPSIRGDATQLQQLFANLLNNSLKYARQGFAPHITISSELVSAEDIPAGSQADSFYRIRFSDNGIGFEQQYANRIFELFQRLHGKTEYSGTGIGLAICKKIVQNHHGMIKAFGEPGKGASFDIYFPASQ